ncbi:hypothetical protein ONS95_011068 [Cadophora gregata]|uniref:uncharacterized protein n=1 Tax=Cadophora gregata TaxID=51156 RepID=UPI0026DAFC73|nr:uncharacterized protein ONS95_011068 [Cadophora gregata]KAK0119630.1 hypothetical protein ONS95_011068 [Cadophora gregata]KAK0120665.1 hypothetical protein ONS96_010867 [Cadophora gregata f. sp. sojae]
MNQGTYLGMIYRGTTSYQQAAVLGTGLVLTNADWKHAPNAVVLAGNGPYNDNQANYYRAVQGQATSVWLPLHASVVGILWESSTPARLSLAIMALFGVSDDSCAANVRTAHMIDRAAALPMRMRAEMAVMLQGATRRP